MRNATKPPSLLKVNIILSQVNHLHPRQINLCQILMCHKKYKIMASVISTDLRGGGGGLDLNQVLTTLHAELTNNSKRIGKVDLAQEVHSHTGIGALIFVREAGQPEHSLVVLQLDHLFQMLKFVNRLPILEPVDVRPGVPIHTTRQGDGGVFRLDHVPVFLHFE